MALYDYNTTGDGDYSPFYDTIWKAQTFTTTQNYDITSVELKMYRGNGETPGTITVSIKAVDGSYKPTGDDLAVGTTDGDTLPEGSGAADWREITFSSSYALSKNTQYAIVMRALAAGGDDAGVKGNDYSSTYAGGQFWSSTDSGSTWGAPAMCDCVFKCNGTPRLIDKTYSRALVAVGGNEVWYESSAGTMAELTAANNDIDCGDPLIPIEAFQKVFIANKTNLKVADFINTKINTTDAGANPCTKGMTLIGGTSGAEMKVDYVDGVTDDAAANVYGYRYTTDTFSSGETVTGTNSDGNTVSFVTSAAETAPPHWYNWTVFGNDTTNYGTMPTSISIVNLYRGRLVYNDDYRPHAWYMTAVENPWKIKYDYDTDGDLSAVTYTNTMLGEVGDIITAIIPYKDDLLIWGCANSVWILVGDPMGSGQNARITDKTGIWGSKAWCIDDKSNLYFLGDDGIYKMPISESYSPPQNISKLVLPNLIADLDLDKSLHRVTFGFDPIKYGIHICKTALTDGTNTNYWYDLMTGGFYPETYPTSCGVFSSYYYPATDDTYKKYLVGCTDGYIREFDNSTENDTTTSSTSAIDSYCTIVGKLSQDEDTEGKMIWINAITSGGASGGDFSDSDSVEYSLYAANDAETALEDIKDGATAFASGTWDGAGKQTKNRVRMRGAWYGLKIGNDDASETWSVNTLYCNIIPAGKLR